MLKYKIYKANSAVYNITKFSDLIPTGLEMSIPGNYTKQQIVKQLKTLNLLDSGAEVSYSIRIADTKTSIYVWRDITYYQAINSAYSTNVLSGSQTPIITPSPLPTSGAGNPPNDPTPLVNNQLRNSANYPVATGYSNGTTPAVRMEVLVVLILENRISSGIIPNLNKNVGTTRALNTGIPGNGDPGLEIQMRPIIYTDSQTQIKNIEEGNPDKNGNFVPLGTPVPAGGQIKSGS